MSTKSQNLQIFITNCKKFLKIEQHVKELPVIEFPVIEFPKEKERQCQKAAMPFQSTFLFDSQ